MGKIQVAPGVTVSSIGVVSNANALCSYAFFVDSVSAQLNGAPYPPQSSRRLFDVAADTASIFAASAVTITLSFDASGQPISAVDDFGLPFKPVPFPSVPGGVPQCSPAVVGANARLTVGAETATAAAWPGTMLSISVS